MVVAHVITDQSAKVWLAQRDDMVKNLAAATSGPTLRKAILPGRLDACPFGLQTRRLQKRDDISIELRVSVQNHVTEWAGVREGLTQLLDDPV